MAINISCFKKTKPTNCHTIISSEECNSPMVIGAGEEESVGYFSAAALTIPIIFLPNFNARKHLEKKNKLQIKTNWKKV